MFISEFFITVFFLKGNVTMKTKKKNICDDIKHRLANTVFINSVCRKKDYIKWYI